MEYLAILNIAFFASLSHCVGMCGGIALALNNKLSKTNQNFILSNLLYNLGRLSSYCLIGAMCGGIGITLSMTPFLKSSVLIVIGILVATMALLFLFAPKVLAFLEFNVQKNGIFMRLFQKSLLSSSYKSFYFLGVLNGFIPCGIVYYFALIALASEGIAKGALVMFFFGICTFVPMLFIGLLSGFSLKIKTYQKQIHIVSICLMFLFGLYTLYKGIKGL